MSLRIAVIGYGSLPNQLTNHGESLLVNAPREAFPSGMNLSSHSPFRPAGLSLPVLLGRVLGADTDARRITMILHPGARDVPVFYAESQYGNLRQAIENLRKREGCQASAIGYVSSGESRSNIPDVARKVQQWAQSKGFDAVIWTDLPAKGVTFGQFPTGREILPLLARDPVLLRNTQAYIDNLVQTNIPLHNEILRMSDCAPPTIVPSSSSSPAANTSRPAAAPSSSSPDPARLPPPVRRSSESFWTRRILIGLPLLALTALIFWAVKRYLPRALLAPDSPKS